MVVGFNHNVQYKGEVFHIQTEDSGINNPHIITLLYRGGTILASKKTSYADIIKVESLDQVVEELMKEQHKEMLRNLKAGQFDERAFGVRAAAPPAPAVAQHKPAAAAQTPAHTPAHTPAQPPAHTPAQPTAHTPAQPAAQPPPRAVVRPAQSLDEVILDYLVRGED